MEIVSIHKLKPLEKIFYKHLQNLNIGSELRRPLIVDEKTGTILDGSHRYAHMWREGYEEVPVLYVDYSSGDISTGISLTKDEIVEHAVSGNLLPPRTTRHKFPFKKEDNPTDLTTLKKGREREIEHLLENHTHKEAVFPGKFNPPHAGHIQTIQRLLNRYHLTVCVTEDQPDNAVMTPREIADEIEFFAPTEVLSGRLIDYEYNPFPGKVVCSGNEDVIKWAKKVGAEYEFIPRAGIISGTNIRNGKNS